MRLVTKKEYILSISGSKTGKVKTICSTGEKSWANQHVLIRLISVKPCSFVQTGGEFLYGPSEGGRGRTLRAGRHTHR